MARILFYKDETVHEYFGSPDSRMIPKEFHGCYAVDTSQQEPSLRYGMYSTSSDVQPWAYWGPKPFNEFPAEFKAWLLILGA